MLAKTEISLWGADTEARSASVKARPAIAGWAEGWVRGRISYHEDQQVQSP